MRKGRCEVHDEISDAVVVLLMMSPKITMPMKTYRSVAVAVAAAVAVVAVAAAVGDGGCSA
jgi:hypothetical protein